MDSNHKYIAINFFFHQTKTHSTFFCIGYALSFIRISATFKVYEDENPDENELG